MSRLAKKNKALEAKEEIPFEDSAVGRLATKKTKTLKSVSVVESEDSDEEPETVSTSTSKAAIISQIKSEREARRLDRETKRQKVINLQIQNRQSRLRKAQEIETVEDEILDQNYDNKSTNLSNNLAPLPENILQSDFLNKSITSQNYQKTRFETESDSETFEFDESDVIEAVRLHRASTNKRRLVETLPYAVVEVGVNGKSRISKAEIKTRRAISKSKIEMAGIQVRRIDSVLDRARKTRSAAAVFHRQNSFY